MPVEAPVTTAKGREATCSMKACSPHECGCMTTLMQPSFLFLKGVIQAGPLLEACAVGGVGHPDIFGLAAGVVSGQMGVSEEPGRVVAEYLRGLIGIAVGALAARPLAGAAEEALAATDVEGHHDAIADLELAIFAADLDHLAHEIRAPARRPTPWRGCTRHRDGDPIRRSRSR